MAETPPLPQQLEPHLAISPNFVFVDNPSSTLTVIATSDDDSAQRRIVLNFFRQKYEPTMIDGKPALKGVAEAVCSLGLSFEGAERLVEAIQGAVQFNKAKSGA